MQITIISSERNVNSMRNHKKIIALGLAAALTFSCLPVQGIVVTDVFAEEEVTGEFIIE